jgi:multiple sugar transport system permease protein
MYDSELVNTFWGLVLPRHGQRDLHFHAAFLLHHIAEVARGTGRIDGLTEFGIFFRIMLPQCVPILITHTVLSFSLGCNDLLWPLLMTATKVSACWLTVWQVCRAEATQYGPAFAGAVISFTSADYIPNRSKVFR